MLTHYTIKKRMEKSVISERKDPISFRNRESHTRYFTSTTKRKDSTIKLFTITEEKEGKRPGIIEFPRSGTYKGEISKEIRNGHGEMIWADGAKYKGEWKKDMAHGKGRFEYANGDVFEGNWENDEINGFGFYLSINGASYEGEWEHNSPCGKGIEIVEDGGLYNGEFIDGKKEGFGVYCWPDGSRYEGDWKDDKMNGKGCFEWPDGREYFGNWVSGEMEGYGVYTWPDGRLYEGEYKGSKKEGYGRLETPDGKIYEGGWSNGLQHGVGKFISTGVIRFGIWNLGELEKWFDLASDVDIQIIKQHFDFAIEDLEPEELSVPECSEVAPVSLEEVDEEMLCKICFENKNNVALVPCGHLVCKGCSEHLGICPFDNQPISRKLIIFY